MSLRDSSEISRAAEMLRELLGDRQESFVATRPPQAPARQAESKASGQWMPFRISGQPKPANAPISPAESRVADALSSASSTPTRSGLPALLESTAPSQLPVKTRPSTGGASAVEPPERTGPATGGFTGDLLGQLLAAMCRRGKFSGSVIADGSGLLLADHNCPVEAEAVAACGSVLGGAMKQAGELLRQNDANNISLDINYVDKVSLHRFEIGGAPFFLMVICPQQVDERSEIEVSIDQIRAILSERASARTSSSPSASS